MALEDAEQTAFRTPFENFYYTVIPFGLNAGITYQWAMTIIFHDMIHDFVEDSKKAENHLKDLKKVLERCQKYKLKMNLLKCAFGVSAGKFLRFVVHKKGISIDEQKKKTYLDHDSTSKSKTTK